MRVSRRYQGATRRWEVVRTLGRGATSAVYGVVDVEESDESVFALKHAFDVEQARLPDEWARLARYVEREELLFGRRGRSRFPTVRDADPEGRFFVMDLVEGVSLVDLLAGARRLTARERVALVVEVAEALVVVEDLGDVALDLKADAIYWHPDTGRVTIIDWNVVASHDGVTRRHHARRLASILDALFAEAPVEALSGSAPPERWTAYPRVIRRLVRFLYHSAPGAREAAEQIAQVDVSMGLAADACLERAVAAMRDAGHEDDFDALRALGTRALDWCDLARRGGRGAVGFRADELALRAQFVVDEPCRVRHAWRAIGRGADAPPGPDKPSEDATGVALDAGGDAPIFEMRHLAGWRTLAQFDPSRSNLIRRAASRFESQQWLEVAATLTEWRCSDDPPPITACVEPLVGEMLALASSYCGWGAWDRDAMLEATRAFERTDEHLRRLWFGDTLRAALPALNGPVTASGEVAVADRARRERSRLDEERRRFVTSAWVRRGGQGGVDDAEWRALLAAVERWQSLRALDGGDIDALVPALLEAFDASRGAAGCLPASTLASYGEILREGIAAELARSPDPRRAGALLSGLDRVADSLRALDGERASTCLPADLDAIVGTALDEARAAVQRAMDDADRLAESLREWGAARAEGALAEARMLRRMTALVERHRVLTDARDALLHSDAVSTPRGFEGRRRAWQVRVLLDRRTRRWIIAGLVLTAALAIVLSIRWLLPVGELGSEANGDDRIERHVLGSAAPPQPPAGVRGGERVDAGVARRAPDAATAQGLDGGVDPDGEAAASETVGRPPIGSAPAAVGRARPPRQADAGAPRGGRPAEAAPPRVSARAYMVENPSEEGDVRAARGMRLRARSAADRFDPTSAPDRLAPRERHWHSNILEHADAAPAAPPRGAAAAPTEARGSTPRPEPRDPPAPVATPREAGGAAPVEGEPSEQAAPGESGASSESSESGAATPPAPPERSTGDSHGMESRRTFPKMEPGGKDPQ